MLSRLKEGEISDVLPAFLPDGRKALRIIRINKYVQAHYANLEHDYDYFKEKLLKKKQDEKLKSWFKSIIKETFFYIAPEFKKCLSDLD